MGMLDRLRSLRSKPEPRNFATADSPEPMIVVSGGPGFFSIDPVDYSEPADGFSDLQDGSNDPPEFQTVFSTGSGIQDEGLTEEEVLVGVIAGASSLARVVRRDLEFLTISRTKVLDLNRIEAELEDFKVSGVLSPEFLSDLELFDEQRESVLAAVGYLKENSVFDYSRLTENESIAIEEMFKEIELALAEYQAKRIEHETTVGDVLVGLSEQRSAFFTALSGVTFASPLKPKESIVEMFEKIREDCRTRLDPLESFGSSVEGQTDKELTEEVFGAKRNWVRSAKNWVGDFFGSIKQVVMAPVGHRKTSLAQVPTAHKVIGGFLASAILVGSGAGIKSVAFDGNQVSADDTAGQSKEASPAIPVPLPSGSVPDESINPNTGKAWTADELRFLSWVDQQISQGKTSDEVSAMLANAAASISTQPQVSVEIGDAVVQGRLANGAPSIVSRRVGGDASNKAQVSARSQAARRNAEAREETSTTIAPSTTVAPNAPVVTDPVIEEPTTTLLPGPTTSVPVDPSPTTSTIVPVDPTTTTAVPSPSTTILSAPPGSDPIAISIR